MCTCAYVGVRTYVYSVCMHFRPSVWPCMCDVFACTRVCAHSQALVAGDTVWQEDRRAVTLLVSLHTAGCLLLCLFSWSWGSLPCMEGLRGQDRPPAIAFLSFCFWWVFFLISISPESSRASVLRDWHLLALARSSSSHWCSPLATFGTQDSSKWFLMAVTYGHQRATYVAIELLRVAGKCWGGGWQTPWKGWLLDSVPVDTGWQSSKDEWVTTHRRRKRN